MGLEGRSGEGGCVAVVVVVVVGGDGSGRGRGSGCGWGFVTKEVGGGGVWGRGCCELGVSSVSTELVACLPCLG